MTSIIDGIICGIGYGIHWYVASKMGFNPRKPKVLFIGFICVFCALRVETFIIEKYDFRGKWDAYQFRKTMIEAEAFEPIDKPIKLHN